MGPIDLVSHTGRRWSPVQAGKAARSVIGGFDEPKLASGLDRGAGATWSTTWSTSGGRTVGPRAHGIVRGVLGSWMWLVGECREQLSLQRVFLGNQLLDVNPTVRPAEWLYPFGSFGSCGHSTWTCVTSRFRDLVCGFRSARLRWSQAPSNKS